MTSKRSIKWKYLIHFILCSSFLYLFCKNSLLRPSPPSAQGKEFFIGAMLLFICYLNALVLHPLLYRKNKIMTYVLWSVFSIVVSLFVEFFCLYSDIMNCTLRNLNYDEANEFFRICILFDALRDAGMLSFTFLICEFNWHHKQEKSLEKLLMASERKIIVKDLSGTDVLLSYKQIRYCEQEENSTKIYGMDDAVYFRYGSLKNFQTLFDDDFFVQIDRKTLIAKNQIRSFTDKQLWITSEDHPFEISPIFQTQMDKLLIAPPSKKKIKRKKIIRPPMVKKPVDNKKRQDVFHIISENPIISAVKLAEQSQLSQSTVNRILKLLKDEGLIEYTGSKKTGGYRVRQQPSSES